MSVNVQMANKAILVIPETKFYKYCHESSTGPNIADSILSKVTGVLQKLQNEERLAVVVLSSENKVGN